MCRGRPRRRPILDLLSSLVDKSLVGVEERDALRGRHLEFFVILAERAALKLNSPRERDWLDALDPDAANLQSAIDYGVETDPERALRIGVAVTAWWEVGGRFATGHDALCRALNAADRSSRPLRARALWSCGQLARYCGDWPAAHRLAEEALAMADQTADAATMARALHTLGTIGMFRDPVGSRRSLSLSRSRSLVAPAITGH